MGWTSAWQKLRSGNIGDAFSYAWLSEEDIRRDREVDAKLREMNARNRDMGIWTEADYARSERNLDAGSIDRQLTGEATSPWGGFKEGAREGAAAMRNAATGFTGTLLGIVPWWGWAAGLGLAAWYVWQNFLRKR